MMNYIDNYLKKIGMIPDMLDGLFNIIAFE